MDDLFIHTSTMLSYWHTPQREPYEWITLPSLLERWAKKSPQAQAYVVRMVDSPRQAITFKQLYDKTQQIGRNLLRLGLRKGDFVIVTGITCIEWILCDFACASVGVITIRCSGAQALTSSDLISIANRNKIKALFFHPGKAGEFEEQHLRKRIPTAFDTGLDKASTCKEIPSLRYLIRMSQYSKDNLVCVADLLSCDSSHTEECAAQIEQPNLDPEDVMTVFLTSGSMGFPKAVPRTHFAGINRYLHSNITQNLNQGDRFFTTRQLAWLGSRIYYPVCFGNTNIYGPPPATGEAKEVDFLIQVLNLCYFLLLCYLCNLALS